MIRGISISAHIAASTVWGVSDFILKGNWLMASAPSMSGRRSPARDGFPRPSDGGRRSSARPVVLPVWIGLGAAVLRLVPVARSVLAALDVAQRLYERHGPGEDAVLGTDDDEEECSVIQMELTRDKGKSRFDNVSKQLLYT